MSATGNKGKEAGYTLIELLVVAAILAAVFSLLPAMLTSLNFSSERQQAARIIELELRRARLAAMTSGDVKTFLFKEGERILPSGIEILSSSLLEGRPIDAVQFYPNGRASGAKIEIRDGDGSIHIHVDVLTGHIERTS